MRLRATSPRQRLLSAAEIDRVTVIDGSLPNNITGLLSNDLINLTNPTPVGMGDVFTKSFTTPVGVFTETLTVILRLAGSNALGILASGTISCAGACLGGTLDPTPVFYSAAYTQNGGPTSQINASFNNSTSPTTKVPEPATLALHGLGLAAFGFMRRRRQQ